MALSKHLRGPETARVVGDLALLRNSADMNQEDEWLASWEIFNLSNPDLPQNARMSYSAIQFLRGLNATPGAEVEALKRYINVTRVRKKEGGISNVKVGSKCLGEGK